MSLCSYETPTMQIYFKALLCNQADRPLKRCRKFMSYPFSLSEYQPEGQGRGPVNNNLRVMVIVQ